MLPSGLPRLALCCVALVACQSAAFSPALMFAPSSAPAAKRCCPRLRTLPASGLQAGGPRHSASTRMAAKGKGGTAKQKLSVVSKGFGAPKDSPLLEMGKRLAKNLGKQSGKNPRLWLDFGAAAAEQEEYADARMILEAGLAECGGSSDLLVSALGQMRRTGPTPEIEALAANVAWPGKASTSAYIPQEHTFSRYSVPLPPNVCARGSEHKTGEGIVCVSNEPILDPAECRWVVDEVNRVANGWKSDKSAKETIGTDNIWSRPFPDRLWLREVPGLLDWFETRLRSHLFPMLQSLYPDIIRKADDLRCHDAFVVRYDASGMADLEIHQDTTSFSFTIALNDKEEYEGGGTVFPLVRPAESAADFGRMAVKAGVGGVCSFPGQLFHGGQALKSPHIVGLFCPLL
jgi:hypothetical protein